MPPQDSTLRKPQAELAVVERPELWLTAGAVHALLSYTPEAVSKREIFRRMGSGEYVTREAPTRSRNGKGREIALSSLTTEAQERYIVSRSDGELALEIAESERGASPAAAEKPLPRGGSNLPPGMPTRMRGSEIPMTDDGVVDIVALRAAGRDTEAETGERKLQIVLICMAELTKIGRGLGRILMYQQIAGRFGQSPKTLRKWVMLYKSGGSRALFPGYGHNRGIYTAIPDGLGRALKAAWRQPQRLTISQIMERVVEPWCAARRWRIPNRTTVARFLNSEVDRAENIRFREGPRAARAKVLAHAVRDSNDLAPNQIFCGDNRLFDFFVMTPDGKECFRPWLTALCDLATGDFTGWCISAQPSAFTIALALRSAILKRGVPRLLYFDRGKDYTAKQYGGKPGRRKRLNGPSEYPTAEELAGRYSYPVVFPKYLQGCATSTLLASLGVEGVMNALPLHPESKPIEPMFKAFHTSWENAMPGYCGNSHAHKPEQLERDKRERKLLFWDQFLDIFAAHLEKWRERAHGGRHWSPNQAYVRAADSIRRASESSLDMLLLKSSGDRPRVIQNNGIEVEGRHFYSPELAAYALQSAHIWWDPCNLTHIVARPVANPNLRIVVPDIGHADFTAFNESAMKVASIKKGQNQRFSLIAAADADAIKSEQINLDPYGANRMASENAAALREPTQVHDLPLVLEDEPLSPLQMIRRADQAGKQTEKAAETARKAVVAANADEIFAQVERQDAWRNEGVIDSGKGA